MWSSKLVQNQRVEMQFLSSELGGRGRRRLVAGCLNDSWRRCRQQDSSCRCQILGPERACCLAAAGGCVLSNAAAKESDRAAAVGAF